MTGFQFTILRAKCPADFSKFTLFYLSYVGFPGAPGLHGIYGLAVTQSNLPRPGLFELITQQKFVINQERPKTFFKNRKCSFQTVITLCMKLLWFCHTNSGQLFCNCSLFVIALVPGLFFGGKPAKTGCHSVVASKWPKTQSVCSAGKNTTT